MTATQTLKTASLFWHDHFDRDCVEDAETVILKQNQTTVTLAITRADILELMSDADYYVDAGVKELGINFKPLVNSARSTLRAIERTFPDLPQWLAEAADAKRSALEAWRVSPEGIAQQAAADAVQAAAKAQIMRHPSVNALREGDQLIDPSGTVRTVIDAWSSFRYPTFTVTMKFIDGTVEQFTGDGQAPRLGTAQLDGWFRSLSSAI